MVQGNRYTKILIISCIPVVFNCSAWLNKLSSIAICIIIYYIVTNFDPHIAMTAADGMGLAINSVDPLS